MTTTSLLARFGIQVGLQIMVRRSAPAWAEELPSDRPSFQPEDEEISSRQIVLELDSAPRALALPVSRANSPALLPASESRTESLAARSIAPFSHVVAGPARPEYASCAGYTNAGTLKPANRPGGMIVDLFV